MRLSIRAKVLSAFAFLAVLVLLVLVVGLTRLQKIGSQLNFIRSTYLPIVRTIDSFAHLYHLDEAFDAHKIVSNRDNPLFVESFRSSSPKMMENQLRKQIADARTALSSRASLNEIRHLKRISEIAEQFLGQHGKYAVLIVSVLKDAREGNSARALARNDELLIQKRIVRSRIDFFSRQLDQRIQNSILATDLEARNAVLWAVGLAIATVLVSVLVGFVSLLTLRPLQRLKEAARQIAEGELKRRVTIETEDEVGDLAREFNRMADSIEQRDEALRRQQETLIQSEKMAVVGRMASRVSHEVRNPLNALSLNVELLDDEVKGEEARRILAALSHEIDRLNAVAGNYLTMSRSPVRKQEMTDLMGLIRGLAAFVEPEFGKKGLRLEVDVDADLPAVQTDPTRIEQALLNLVKNSMEASRDNGRVGIRARRSDSRVEIEVWDEGRGIPPEILPHVFEPFYTTKEKGTGLGLAITREIIRDEGGTIECASEPGRGTRFTIRLPVPGE